MIKHYYVEVIVSVDLDFWEHDYPDEFKQMDEEQLVLDEVFDRLTRDGFNDVDIINVYEDR